MVEHMTHNPKIKGSNHTTGTDNGKMAKRFSASCRCPGNTVVEYNTKIEGSNPSSGTERVKMSKKFYSKSPIIVMGRVS